MTLLTLVKLWLNFEVKMPKTPFFTGFEAVLNFRSFPKAFMEKIAAKSMEGVTFVFHYKWNHVKQEITIPFGTAVDTQFDWYGPAKMAELYGAY